MIEQTDGEWLAEIFQHEKWCDACGLAEDGHTVTRDEFGLRHARCLLHAPGPQAMQ